MRVNASRGKNVNKRARSPCQSIFALSCKQDKGSKLFRIRSFRSCHTVTLFNLSVLYAKKNTDDIRMNRIRFRDVEMNIEENWHKLTCLTITTPHRYRANNKKKKKKEDEQRLHEYTHRVKFASDVTYCCNFSSSSSFPPSSPLPPILQISFPEASGLRL